jgi:alcohol dehydrogenase/L-iditol 2-dehydrogenase
MRRQPAVVQYAVAPLSVELRDVDVPDIGETDVLLEVGAVSVCGSDVHQHHNTQSWAVNVPVVLGHEFTGTVARAGRGVKNVREGDRVVSETAAEICGRCRLCLAGRYHLCPSRKGFGYGVNGAMAQYVRVPARCLHAIPDSLPFEIACLAEPHAVAFHAMSVNASIHPGDAVVVIGPGPIGLLCTRIAALRGASPLIVAGLSADHARFEVARRLGATHTVDVEQESLEDVVRGCSPIGADLICDASGASEPLGMALRLARPDGQVVKVGWSPDLIPIDVNPIVQKNLRVQGSFSHNHAIWEQVIQLLSQGVTMPDQLVGMRAPITRWREAFDAMHERAIIKAVLIPSE